MSIGSRKKHGFTLVEALASVVILAIGIAATLRGLGAMSKADARLKESETMMRLANQKLDELVVTTASLSAPDSGDFADRNETRYSWASTIDTSSSITNLVIVTVTVSKVDDQDSKVSLSGAYYQAPTSTAGTTALNQRNSDQ